MLKQLTAWFLIFSVLTVNYSRLFVYAGFKLNQNYIAAKLCENRGKPLLHCNGKCYLMKKIRQAEDKQNNAESQAQKNLFQDIYCLNDCSKTKALYHTCVHSKYSPSPNCGKLPDVCLSVFRPPQLG